MGFAEIFGQEQIVKNLRTAIQQDRIAHAYIFDGAEGLGKGMTAVAFAQAIICKAFQQEPCNTCSACIKFRHNNHPDIMMIEPEGASIKNKQIEAFQQDLQRKPYESSKKVYIIKQGDQMTESAQNRLLKTLEEPPEYGVIILISENANRFLPTIRSRCQMMKFHRLGEQQILLFLREKYGMAPEESRVYAAFSDGIPGKAVQLKESPAFLEKREATIGVIEKVLEGDPLSVFSLTDFFESNKDNIQELLDFMLTWFRDILILKETSSEDYLINLDKKRALNSYALRIGYQQISHIIKIIERTKGDLKANINFQLAIENMLLSMQEV